MRRRPILGLLVLAMIVTSPCLARDCPLSVGQWGYGPISAVEVENGVALIASGTVLQIADVSRPINLEVLGAQTFPELIEDFAHAGNGKAVVATGESGFWLVDLSDPTAPVVDRLSTGVPEIRATNVVASGNLVFAAGHVGNDERPETHLSIIDISDPETSEVLSSVIAEGSVEDMAADGELVYLALTDAILLQVDVSTPQQPSIRTFDDAHDGRRRTPVRVTTCGDVVYFAEAPTYRDGQATVYAIDRDSLSEKWSVGGHMLSFTTGPWFISDVECAGSLLLLASSNGIRSLDTGGSTASLTGTYGDWSNRIPEVELVGELALVVSDSDGLFAIDVSDPAEIVNAGLVEVPGYNSFHGMATVEHDLIGASRYDGLTIVDIANPSRPRLVANDPDMGLGYYIAATGTHAYVGTGERGVEIIDLADLTNPESVGWIETDGNAGAVLVHQSHLFTFSDRMQVFDLSSPTQPTEVAAFDVTGTPHLDDDHLLVAAGDGLRIVDVVEPSSPTLLGWYQTDWLGPDSGIGGLACSGDLVYVTPWISGPWRGSLHIVNIADPGAPVGMGATDLPDPTFDPIVVNDVLIAGTAYHGLVTIDVSIPELPSGITYWGMSIPSSPYPIAMSVHGLLGVGPIAWVGLDDFAHGLSALRAIDLSNPSRPRFPWAMHQLPEIIGVAVGDGIAVTNETWNSIRVFDLSDPESPKGLATLSIPRIRNQMAVEGTAVFVAGGNEGLTIVDLQNPEQPRTVAVVQNNTWALATNRISLVASVSRGGSQNPEHALEVYGIADPDSPVLMGSCPVDYSITDLAIEGDIAVGVATWTRDYTYFTRVRVFDVADPTEPAALGLASRRGYPTAVAISGNTVFVTMASWVDQEQHGLHVFDITDSSHPVEIAILPTPGQASDVIVVDNLAYVADLDTGILVLDITNPAAPVEIGWIDTPGTPIALAADGRTLVVADGAGGLTTFTNLPCPADDPRVVPSVVD